MNHIRLLVYAWNTVAFGACAYLLFRDCAAGARIWGGMRTALLALDVALIYAMNVRLHPPMPPTSDWPWVTCNALNLGVPPLIVDMFFHEERKNLRRIAWWGFGLVAVYAACAATLALTVIAPFCRTGWWSLHLWSSPAFQAILFVACGITALMIWQTRHSGVPAAKRKLAGWLAAGFVALGCVHLLWFFDAPSWVGAVEGVIPGSLLFVLAYYVQPLTFDVLIKEVSFSYFVLVAVYSAWWLVPAVGFLAGRSAFPALILCVWPAISVVPWLRAKWLRWIDAALFQRKFTPTEARAFFLAGLEGAITEENLARSAERALIEILGSASAISLSADTPPTRGPGMYAAVRAGGEVCGSIQVAPKVRNLQFMGADIALLNSLASEFSIMLDNHRLREKKIDQERREKDLQILATRAELKALRAQIDPHFLFNSLGAIAGLISRDASRARETVEQLAEVFRYTLCRSENEWVRLAEEMDFVTAYLDVERSRFGPRLKIEIAVEEAAQQLLVPAMVMQVLVENAIQHGVCSVRGAGIVNIRGQCRGDRLLLEVRDNGNGFKPADRAPRAGGQGFGLRNIEERLHLYFGDRGALRIGREGSMTVVAIEFPAQRVAAAVEGARP
ncbi:MAG: sensor histidine kinase [Bryobacteraceae bacterium]